MKKRIAIIGSNGQVGSELVKTLANEELFLLDHKNIEITDFAGTRKKIEAIKPDVVINTAAFHRTDDCEIDTEKAFFVNCFAIKNLADICKDNNITFVHFSTDYVFGGEKNFPYDEEDIPSPLNVYGQSKLAGEYFVRKLRKYFLIRTAYVFGFAQSSQKRTNLVETFLRIGKIGKLAAVTDHFFSPTYAKDLAEKVAELLKTERYGLYHITNQGECSIYDFAMKIFKFEGLNPEVEKIKLSDSKGKAMRPRYSVLGSINLINAGISPMRNWIDALNAYLKERMDNQITNLDLNKKIDPNNSKIITGVELVKRQTHSDDRGHLTEVYRVDEAYHLKYGGPLRQVYIVEDEEKGIIRAFHKHKELWDFFYISNGTAKFILIDDRPDSETYGMMNIFILSRLNKGMLIVPPGVFHGWMSLTQNTQLVSVASHTYNHDKPDEVRISPSSFGTEWEVKGK